MQPALIVVSAVVGGLVVLSKIGIIAFFKYSVVVTVGLFIFHYVNRKVPQYPSQEVYELFMANPHHGGKVNAEGIVAIVTGSTSGIGQKIAEELFRYGATVIIASRNQSKGEAVIKEIFAANPGSKGKLVFGKLDTSDLDSVRDFAKWVGANYDHIDYLVNNAGIQYGASENSPLTNLSTSITSKQGYDLCFVTNYMGHFLLTHLLLPKLTGRIVNIASSFHFQADGKTLNPALGEDGKTPSAAIGDNKPFTHRARAYGVSKLANVFHAIELQKRLKGYGYGHLTVVSVCPGWVQTGILGHKTVEAHLVHSNAFKPQEGVLSSMAAIFDKDLQGGEFVSNHIMPLSTYPWFDAMLLKLTEKDIRNQVTLLLATAVLFLQSQSYGHHTHKTSPECKDEKLTAAFYDWTLEELKSKGYVSK
jgi:NAD(P)-dependent dehydrogenase (short-subunit alcohol dehydrogenase family)